MSKPKEARQEEFFTDFPQASFVDLKRQGDQHGVAVQGKEHSPTTAAAQKYSGPGNGAKISTTNTQHLNSKHDSDANLMKTIKSYNDSE